MILPMEESRGVECEPLAKSGGAAGCQSSECRFECGGTSSDVYAFGIR